MDALKEDLSAINAEKLHAAVTVELKKYRKDLLFAVPHLKNHFWQSSKFIQRKINLFKKEERVVANALMLIHLLGYCDYLKKRTDDQLLPRLDKLIDPELKNKLRDSFPNEIQSVCSNIKENFKKFNLPSVIGSPMLESSQDWIQGLHSRLTEETSYVSKKIN